MPSDKAERMVKEGRTMIDKGKMMKSEGRMMMDKGEAMVKEGQIMMGKDNVMVQPLQQIAQERDPGLLFLEMVSHPACHTGQPSRMVGASF
ncbi:MAG: hypothetical protein HY788_08110 [Deltaproteobacteria bacterium]|nr:hypothetical protein [Deltaproteobacteria bacterium]